MAVTVVVTLTEEEHEEAKKAAAEKGLTVAQYVKRYPIGGDEFEERYAFLLKKAKEYKIGEKFTVMSIFEDWKEIPRGVKLSLGRNFFHLVQRGELENVETAGKNPYRVQLYIRKA